MSHIRTIAALLGLAAVVACEKNAVQSIDGEVPGARVKFFNFGVNAPGVNFYANDRKITAISSVSGTESTLGTAYGSAGSGGFYSAIAPGQYTFTGRIAATTDKDLPIFTLDAALQDGKYYSVYQSGFYDATAKRVEGFIVEDPVPATVADYSQARVRLVNAMPNATPLTLVARNPTSGVEFVLGTDVAYKSAGAFVALPEGSYDLTARTAGGTTLVTRTAVAFTGGRVYTIAGRGDATVTSTSATNRPFLDNTANW